MPPSINSMTEPQRPPASDNGPSALDAMKTSKPAPSPAAVKTLGNDQSKMFDQAGGEMFVGLAAGRVPEATPGQPGDNSNTEATPPGYPRKAGSRAPQASAPGPRTKNLAKLRGGR